jgi:phosphoglycolate phosphatase-like HAD superfamily hydrolase
MENNNQWIKVINPAITNRLGHIRHVLFDFDGTLSVLRQGWEPVMAEVMIGAICGDTPVTLEIEQEVGKYIDQSTGILTILQMQWLVEAVRRHARAAEPLTAAKYKAIYLQRLMQTVNQRIRQIEEGQVLADQWMVAGAGRFLAGLDQRGARLYAASGTDHADVVHEAQVLGLAQYFTGGIYGALDAVEAHAKERIIQRILDENHLSGDELMVVGDGPVEIREGQARQAIALGVASDEVARHGWNPHKLKRLINANADCLVADFSQPERLLAFIYK